MLNKFDILWIIKVLFYQINMIPLPLMFVGIIILQISFSSTSRFQLFQEEGSCDSLDYDPFIQVKIIENGENENLLYSEGTVVKFSCIKGFEINKFPNNTATCVGGKWKPQNIYCSPKTCKVPYIHGITFYQGNKALKFQEKKRHQSVIEPKCSFRYKLKGSKTLRCLYGDWDLQAGFLPDCIPLLNENSNETTANNCGPPPNENGTNAYIFGVPVDFENHSIFEDGSEVIYRCKTWKSGENSRWTLKCMTSQWEGSNGNCSCNDHLNITESPRSIRTFTDIQEFFPINASCNFSKKDYENIYSFHDDMIINEEFKEFSQGSIVVSRCLHIGIYHWSGAVKRVCISGQWLGLAPKCIKEDYELSIELNRPPTILFTSLNGSFVQSSEGDLMLYPGTTLHLDCLWPKKFGKVKWSFNNETYMKYQVGWTSSNKSEIEYRLTIQNAQPRDSGSFTCNTITRYNRTINVIVKEAKCPKINTNDELLHSSSMEGNLLGTLITFACRESHKIIAGSSEIFCNSNGKWSGSLPTCKNVTCPDISNGKAIPDDVILGRSIISVANVSITGTHVGAEALFICKEGFMDGNCRAECQSNGEWSSSVPMCKAGCSHPGTPTNGIVSPMKFYYTIGSKISIECEEEYQLDGSEFLHCLKDKSWDTALPNCIPIPPNNPINE